MRLRPIVYSALATLASSAASAQHAQVSCVAVRPGAPNEVWVCNRDNDSVSVIDVSAGVATHEIPVGVRPRSLAFSADGSKLFVANQRGNVPVTANMATGFVGTEIRGTVSVIDAAARTVAATLTSVGTEPYGVAVAPNGQYFAVSAFRSGEIRLFDVATHALLAQYAPAVNTSFVPAPLTIADVDSNRDGIADESEPRGFAIRADSARLYVTHGRSVFVSVLAVALDGSGRPTAVTRSALIDLDTYAFHPVFNPVPVRSIASQGVPRFAEDVALSPDGSLALVPHLLHNVAHDVNFDFGPGLPGAFANRVYPALSVIDAALDSFAQPGDASRRLQNELSEPLAPASFASFGTAAPSSTGRAILGGVGAPTVGGVLTLRVSGIAPGESASVYLGPETSVPMGPLGEQLVLPRFVYPVPPNGLLRVSVPNRAALKGASIAAQALFFTPGGQPACYSNGIRVQLDAAGVAPDALGHRAGHPSRVAFNAAGDRALLLNRGSEDLFLYSVSGNSFRLLDVFPPRIGFAERAALDTTTPLGDLPLGLALAPDPATSNDDALAYVMNELTRTLSVLRVDWSAGVIVPERPQIATLLAADDYTPSQRLGDELFEDASRAQTTAARGTVGEFNNSCASCHFEGGDDANVWQRGHGPRSTMPVYGGSLATGLILWKGVRLNMGETGPMFGGENGGHGLLSDAEQQALVDMHALVPVPLNPNLDPVTGALSPQAQLGRDLFFGTNATGLNPTLRRAGCGECHPRTDTSGTQVRGFTADFLDPALTSGENLQSVDPLCFSLQGNIVVANIRNVNSGVNVDLNNDGTPDPDRNSDGYVDVETYAPMNADKRDDFTRDDVNSYRCPSDPSDPQSALKNFVRDMRMFSIPTKLGVFSSAPYFHDHCALSLRSLVDPAAQAVDPVYGQPAYGALPALPGLNKLFNEFHDIRGHEQFVPGASKVQINLQSGANVQSDIDAILAFIQSI